MNYLERRRHEAWLRGESQGQASVFQGKETKGPHMTQPEDDAARLEKLVESLYQVALEFTNDNIFPKAVRPEIEKHIKRYLADRDARERMVTEAASNLAARVEECVLSSNYCYDAHNFRCSYDKAFYRNIENPFISRDERHKAAEAAGCNCGMQDEHDQVEKATQELRAALSAKSDEQTEAG